MKTQVFALFVGLTWLLIPQVTMAQSKSAADEDSAKAAVRFQQAVELYREGSYEGALAEFRKACQISPSYRVLFNIAQTQYALHDFVGAHKSLMQYTAEGRGEIPADRRAQVDEMLAKLDERIAQLRISTNVTGADIRVDGVSVGESPLPGLVPVNVGTRKVSAFKNGAPEAVRMVTVAGKESVKIELQINESIVTPAASAPSAVPPSVPVIEKTQPRAVSLIKTTQPPVTPGRTGLIVSLSTTAVLGVGTGVFGYLALNAQKDLKDQVNTYPNSRANIENARTRSKNYGYVADALGAATIISGGVALYFVLSHSGVSPKPKSGKAIEAIVVAPTVGGIVFQGSF
jgi:tetratricopeptide (TPR) repeat protein